MEQFRATLVGVFFKLLKGTLRHTQPYIRAAGTLPCLTRSPTPISGRVRLVFTSSRWAGLSILRGLRQCGSVLRWQQRYERSLFHCTVTRQPHVQELVVSAVEGSRCTLDRIERQLFIRRSISSEWTAFQATGGLIDPRRTPRDKRKGFRAISGVVSSAYNH